VVLSSGAILTVGTPEEVAADERVKQLYFGRDGHVSQVSHVSRTH
jgi:ABC-type lipopolysaccharide export system ATPase subunit